MEYDARDGDELDSVAVEQILVTAHFLRWLYAGACVRACVVSCVCAYVLSCVCAHYRACVRAIVRAMMRTIVRACYHVCYRAIVCACVRACMLSGVIHRWNAHGLRRLGVPPGDRQREIRAARFQK